MGGGGIIIQNMEHISQMVSLQPADSFIFANNLQFHYRRWQPAVPQPERPPVLLLHGLASSSHIWNFVAPLLAEQGYEVIALDQRGHGESTKPDHGYNFASILADDQAVVQELSLQRPIVVGHSWGAMAALEYAAAPGANISALILVDGATQQFSRRPGWTLEKALAELAPPRYAGVSRETFLGFFSESPLAKQWTPEIEASVLHIVDQHDDGTVAPRLTFENHLQIIEAMWHQPTLDLYARVHCPLQIIIAEHEPTNDAASRLRVELRERGLEGIHKLQPEARIVRMPDTIHDIPLQRPARLAEEILEFVTAGVTSRVK